MGVDGTEQDKRSKKANKARDMGGDVPRVSWERKDDQSVVRGGIARTTFHNRLRQIREAALEPKHEIVPVNADDGSMSIPTDAAEGMIRITGRGITAELPQDISPELLTTLLKGLSSC